MSSEPVQAFTEVLHSDMARFPRARLTVLKGPDKGREILLEGQTVVIGSDDMCDLRLTDAAVSRRHFELSGGPEGYRLRDLRSTNGIFVEGVQVLEAKLTEKVRLSLGRSELRFEPERTHVQWPLSPREYFGEALGRSTAMRRLFAILEKVAVADSPVLLEGEPGTGKEMLARCIHEKSQRNEHPFIVVDLGSSSEQLMESDLFGHEVGVFQGNRSTARPGAFEEAQGGILFLDEISALTPALQAKLLRALETNEFKRAGAKVATAFEVRVIASSTKNLEAEAKAGRFREDLFFKLSVFRAQVPPLRERLDDIPMLVRQFESRNQPDSPLTETTLHMLSRHDWPGNVRELRNVVERLEAFPDLGSLATARALGDSNSNGDPSGEKISGEVSRKLLAMPYHEAKERVLESFEKTYLLEHLRASNNIVTRAAQRAGLPRQSLHRMMRRLGIQGNDEE